MTIQGIAPCIFGEMFKDPTLVKQMTEAYIPAWDEIQVGFNKTVIVLGTNNQRLLWNVFNCFDH